MPPKVGESYGATGGGLSAPGQKLMEELGDEVCISRELAVIELFGLEGKNNYKIRKGTNQDGAVIAFTSEESGCFERIAWCHGREATFEIHDKDKSGPVLVKIKKNRHCHCCPLCSRPSAAVYDSSGHHLGSIEDPFSCCNYNHNILDADGNTRYNVNGSCCQLGNFCPCLGDVELEISTAGKVVGQMRRLALSAVECFCPMTRFHMTFPKDATAEDKALLLAGHNMMDIVYFGQEQQDIGAVG